MKVCRLSKKYKSVSPTLPSLLCGDLTAANSTLSLCCFILHFWHPILMSCAVALSTFKKSEKKKKLLIALHGGYSHGM